MLLNSQFNCDRMLKTSLLSITDLIGGAAESEYDQAAFLGTQATFLLKVLTGMPLPAVGL